jgi:hypothetical protein
MISMRAFLRAGILILVPSMWCGLRAKGMTRDGPVS